MSDPIGNIPVENRAIPTQPENVSVLSTKVSEIALPIFDSKQPQSLSLDPSRVDQPVSVTKFKWCWNFEEEENSLVWTTALEESSIREINKHQYPVLQPVHKVLESRFLTAKEGVEKFPDQKSWVNCEKFLESMGFSYQKGNLRTPTREQFVINYSNCQSQNSKLPSLEFEMVDEILEPDEFVLRAIKSDLTLSNGQDLIHDFIYHAIPTLMSIFQAPEVYRTYKDRLNITVMSFLEFINKNPGEILEELNKITEQSIERSHLSHIIATLKFMVGAALDLLSGQILNYEQIVQKDNKTGGVRFQFYNFILRALWDPSWRSPLKASIPSLEEDFLDDYQPKWNQIVDAVFKAAGLVYK